MKRNPIVVHPEIMKAVYSLDDDIFLKSNPYGYLANLKHPQVLDDYKAYCILRGHAKILSDEERFNFDNLCIKKYRPQIAKAVKKYEIKEGSGLLKIVTADSGSGIILYWDEGRKNESGELEEWLLKYPDRKKKGECIKEWIKTPQGAVARYTDTICDSLFHRLNSYYKKSPLP